jgi:hypothetical protein
VVSPNTLTDGVPKALRCPSAGAFDIVSYKDLEQITGECAPSVNVYKRLQPFPFHRLAKMKALYTRILTSALTFRENLAS